MPRWPLAVVGALGVAALASPSVNCDGGSTAPSLDAAPPADAGADDASDVATPDAAGDGAIVCPPGIEAGASDWPGWHRTIDPCCTNDVPLDVEAAVPALEWIPCSDAGDCFDMNTPPVDGVPRIIQADVSRDALGAPQFLLLGRGLTADKSSAEWVVYSLATHAPLAAWRDTNLRTNCSTFGVNVCRDKAALLYREKSSGRVRLASGDLAGLMAAPALLTLAGLENRFALQETALSSSLFAFDLVPSGIIFRAALDSGTYVSSQGKQPVSPLILDFAEGDDVYAWSEHGTVGRQQEYRIMPDGTAILYWSRPNADVSGFRTDGTTMFWTETYDPAPDAGSTRPIEVWAAPYTADPATLATTARRIATATAQYVTLNAIAFSGLYAIRTGTNAVVVRLSDGAVRELTPPAGYDFDALSLITSTELWTQLARTRGPSGVAYRRIGLGTW